MTINYYYADIIKSMSIEWERLVYETTNSGSLPATGPEPKFAANFRTATAILDLLYLLLLVFQRFYGAPKQNTLITKSNLETGITAVDNADDIRSNRQGFTDSRLTKYSMLIHIIVGSTVVYIGCGIHVWNLASTITVNQDEDVLNKVLYYIMGSAGLIHSFTVLPIVGRVYGEKRITIPLYLGAGLVNCANSLTLLISPNLSNAFLLWGSMNTFVYVRAYVLPLSLLYIDWELVYTYGLLSAFATTYPLTLQSPFTFLLIPLPIFYGPIHERFCSIFGWKVEDTLNGNKPSEKNLSMTKTIVKEFIQSHFPWCCTKDPTNSLSLAKSKSITEGSFDSIVMPQKAMKRASVDLEKS